MIVQAVNAVLAQFPSAAYLEMDVSDQGSNQMFASRVLALDLGMLSPVDWDMEGDLYDVLAETIGCLYDDSGAARKRFEVFPFGAPRRNTTGRPCLDLTKITAELSGVVRTVPDPRVAHQ